MGVALVAVDGGYVAALRIEDPNKSPSHATHILTVALDRDGNVRGDLGRYSAMDYACHGAGAIEGRVIMAYKSVARGHRHQYDMLGVLVVNRNGDYEDDGVIATNPIACASAVRGREIAVVWTRWVETGSASRSPELRIAFEDPLRRRVTGPFSLPVGSVDVAPVRVAPHGDDWVVLYSDQEDHMHLAFVDTRGMLLGTRELPRNLDYRSVDLAICGCLRRRDGGDEQQSAAVCDGVMVATSVA
jgi:hypothetical protein